MLGKNHHGNKYISEAIKKGAKYIITDVKPKKNISEKIVVVDNIFDFLLKIAKEKRSPLFPDGKHLHMLVYKKILKKIKNKLKSNYYVSVAINSMYLILIIPPIFFMENGMFCKYYSIVLFLVYLVSYKTISQKT